MHVKCLLMIRLCCRGHAFLSTNEELLDRYAACATSAEVITVQNEWLEQLQETSRQRHTAQEGKPIGVYPRAITCRLLAFSRPEWGILAAVLLVADV